MTEQIYSMDASRCLLGALLNNPQILLTSKYDITREDFKPFLVHYRLMAAIENLVATGASDIDSMMVQQFVEPYAEVWELFNDNNTFEFIDTIKKMINADNIEVYYNKVKKLSALRDYRDSGFNIDKYFDVTRDSEEQMGKLDIIGLDDIINHFDGLNTKVKRKYNKKDASEEYTPDDDLKKIIQSFKESPMQGYCMQSSYLTTIGNGALRGHFWLRSGGSGSGKSTLMIADACMLSATELYDEEYGIWHKNKNRQGGNLHIHLESDTKTEIIPIYLSFIAKVERDKITKGLMTEEEEERVLKAVDILKESDIHIVSDPKYTIPSVREHIKYYTSNFDIFVVNFDYLCVNNVVNVELIKETKNFIPDYQVLLIVAEEFKRMAEEFNIFFMSGTQLNGKEKEMDFPDGHCLTASSQIIFKLDLGCISMMPKPKELKQVEQYVNKKGFKNLKVNRVLAIYKSRFNSTGYERIKIFQHVDLSKGVSIDLFCTDEDNNLIGVARTVPKK